MDITSTAPLEPPVSAVVAMRSRQFCGWLLQGLFWVPMLWLMSLIFINTIPYFTHPEGDLFFAERPVAYRSIAWRVVFYIHITSGIVALFVPLLQFSKTVLKRVPHIHRRLGSLYVHGVLWLVVPSGAYMAWYAKGGIWSSLLFTLMGVVHFYFTWAGWRSLRGGKQTVRAHAKWMIRSYAIALTAVSFRLYHVGLMIYGVENFYVHALWLSLFTNVILAELLLAIIFRTKSNEQRNQTI